MGSPLILTGVLIILTLFLLNLLANQSFKLYTNCAYLFGNRLAMPAFFCDGYNVKVLDTTIFAILVCAV